MSPITRFVLDLICWFGTALVIAYWGYTEWAIGIGLVGAFYLAYCWTILRHWMNGQHDDIDSEF